MKRTKKKLKIKWKNIAVLIVFLMCGYIVVHDIYMLTIYSWITGIMYGWTWFGLLTFLLALTIGGEALEYIIEEFKK